VHWVDSLASRLINKGYRLVFLQPIGWLMFNTGYRLVNV
jgi:hypothetical protein